MKSKEKNNIILLRLYPKENILTSLKHIAKKHNIKTAIIFSGIGQITDPTLGYFKEKNNYKPHKFSGIFELLNLSGNIIFNKDRYETHVHAVIGDEQKHTLGGHLIDGTVSITNEIALIKTAISTKRIVSEETGLADLEL